MSLAAVPYRSSRRLRGLGIVSESGSYIDYGKAIYQAINGDVVGGIYNAAITYAGPVAAIGNAIANFANKGKDLKSASTQALLDSLVQNGIFKQISLGRAGNRFITPSCTLVNPDEHARAVSEAIRKQESPETVATLFKAWMATGTPFRGTGIYSNICPTGVSDWLPAMPPDVPSSPQTAMPAPIVAPVPAVINVPSMPAQSIVLPAAPNAPSITVNAPASVPPDQTPLLIQTLMTQGATQQQAYLAALKSLAARGVAATPVVQQRVANDVTRAGLPQMASTLWIVLGFAALFGVGYLLRNRT